MSVEPTPQIRLGEAEREPVGEETEITQLPISLLSVREHRADSTQADPDNRLQRF